MRGDTCDKKRVRVREFPTVRNKRDEDGNCGPFKCSYCGGRPEVLAMLSRVPYLYICKDCLERCGRTCDREVLTGFVDRGQLGFFNVSTKSLKK
jgi:hypothetical protein